jgi:hypothetical protein
MQRNLLLSSVCATAVVAAACSTTYSQISGGRYHPAAIDTYPVMIVKVDGASELRQPVYVQPGLRKITVQTLPSGAQSVGDEQTVTLDIKPCTRYWLVAVKDGPLSRMFTTKIDHEEPISGCTPAA